jgi:hypothetical protein
MESEDITSTVVRNNGKRPLEEQERIHFMAVCDLLNPHTGKELRDISLGTCQDMLSRGVGFPISQDSMLSEVQHRIKLLVEFLRFAWPKQHLDAVEQLFRGYVRAGQIDINATLEVSLSQGSSGLEHAVATGRARLVAALIEEGADITGIPVAFGIADVRARMASGPAAAGPTDLVAFIENQTHLPEDTIAVMRADALAALMQRQMGGPQSVEGEEHRPRLPPVTPQHRRAGL